MRIQNEVEKKNNGLVKFLKEQCSKTIIKYSLIGLGIFIFLGAGIIGLRDIISFESKTTKIGFENIGELATQSAYCTEVSVIDNGRELFGVTIPFTQSKYICSYDIVIKAGFDFADIEWKENVNDIEVKLPEVRILSSEIQWDSFEIYHEKESIFNQVTMIENNEAMMAMKEEAEVDAIANGLLDNARANAEMILTVFFRNKFDEENYEITFKDK